MDPVEHPDAQAKNNPEREVSEEIRIDHEGRVAYCELSGSDEECNRSREEKSDLQGVAEAAQKKWGGVSWRVPGFENLLLIPMKVGCLI